MRAPETDRPLTTPQSGADDRLRSVRLAWDIAERELDGLDAAEIAGRLHVRLSWLLTGREPMVDLAEMTVEQQHAEQNGPSTADQPGYVISGAGPWHRVGGRWAVDLEWKEESR